jgi:hypothetical protein
MPPATETPSPARTAATACAGQHGAQWLSRGTGLLVFIAMLVSMVASLYPVPKLLRLHVSFPSGIPGRGEPLVTSGTPGNADFLAVRYIDASNAVLVHDSWGRGGPTSAPFALEAGKVRTIDLELPVFANEMARGDGEQGTVRVLLDGHEVLNTTAPFHRNVGLPILLGLNQSGGSAATESFRGTLATVGGRQLRGDARLLFTWRDRLGWAVSTHPWRLLTRFLIILLIALGVKRIVGLTFGGHSAATAVAAGAKLVRRHAAFIVVTTFSAIAFAAIMTGGAFKLRFEESFGSFFDWQAVSILEGRLDVPEPALSGEAFIVGGHYYGYFGPAPALMRIPLVIVGAPLAVWSRMFLLIDYVAALVAVYALLLLAVRQINPTVATPRKWSVTLFVASVGLGSTLFFLGARAYIYHEAILCGVAFALWSSYCSLRWLAAPASRWWTGALGCGILSVHARPPVGLFALSLVGMVALIGVVRAAWISRTDFNRSVPERLWASGRPLAIAVLAALGILSFNGLSYLKFGSFDGAPLRYHVQYNPTRLAHIKGRNFHSGNLRYNFDGYLWRATVNTRRQFPYLYERGINPGLYPRASIDVAEPVLSLPYAMPALFLLGTAGGLIAFWRVPGSRLPLFATACATMPMAGALFTAIALSHRYTADFCPALIVAAAFALAACELAAPLWRRMILTLLSVVTVGSIVLTFAITLYFQNEVVWGVPPEMVQHYRQWQHTVDKFFHLSPP